MSDMDGATGGNRSAIAPGRGSLSTTTANVFAGSSSSATAAAGAVGGPVQPQGPGPLLNFNLDSLIDDTTGGSSVGGATAISAAAVAAGRSARFMVEGVGARVIRGPDWKWGKQVREAGVLLVVLELPTSLIFSNSASRALRVKTSDVSFSLYLLKMVLG